MTEPRPKQSIPQEIKTDLLNAIRGAFYGDATDKQWHQDKHFILRTFVLWPAGYLDRRGVTLPPTRYKAVVLGVIQGIKQHGQTGAVKFWPGYLAHCLQTHFRLHGEEYYEEGKALRKNLAAVLSHASSAPTVDPIRLLAAHRRDLLARKPRPKAKNSAQLPLLQALFLAAAIALQTA
jgi:hypothetical protein